MTRNLPRAKAPIELVRPSFYGMLICYYSAIFGYGGTTVALGSVAIQHTAGYSFAFVWAILLGCGSLLAILGIIFSIWLRSHWFELVGTITVISMMFGYAVAVVMYATATHEVARYSATWLPIVISVLPVWRISVMATDGTIGRKRAE